MLYQIVLALLFYLVFTLFAAIGLPFASRFIPNKTLAYAASKPTGLIIFGYFVWLLSRFHLLDYQNDKAIITLLTLAVLTGALISRNFFATIAKESENKNAASNAASVIYRKIFITEAATMTVYAVYLLLRSHNAAINGTERFMDMALLTASGKTHFFPFADPWYEGKAINYYYYGHYLISLLSNIAKLPYALSYNIAIGLIYAYTAVLSAMLIHTVTGKKIAAIVAAFMVTSAGTLFFAGCTLKAFLSDKNQVCSYASSTRLYSPSYIIMEIPSYSFTVGDMHSHMIALPFFLLGLILVYSLVQSQKPRFGLLMLLALALATSGMIDSWDFATLTAVMSIASLIMAVKTFHVPQPALRLTREWVLAPVITLLAAGLLMWPNLKDFYTPILGIGFASTFVSKYHLQNVQYPTPFLAILGVWGVFAASIALYLKVRWKQLLEDIFLVSLAIVSFGILIGIELFFIKDIYSVSNPPFFRANTTFKFGYHAWVMLSLVFSAWMGRMGQKQPDIKQSRVATWAARLLLILAVIGGVFYPYQAMMQFYLSNHSRITLDGAKWMQLFDQGDFDTVKYINRNLHERVVIAEAVGDSYSGHSRIVTYTGMITPMGWMTHEWVWRFHVEKGVPILPGVAIETGWAAVSLVSADIQTLYKTPNIAEAARIINKYNIEYVYVGNLERTDYKELQEEKFNKLCKVVFSSFNNRLYKVVR